MKKKIEWQLPLYLVVIMSLGLFILYSATYGGVESHMFNRQIIWLLVSLLVFFAISIFKKRFWQEISYPLALISILLLVAVLFTREIAGSHRWIDLGPINLQPSEIAKFSLIIFLAKLYSSEKSSFWQGLAVTLIMAGLIYKEPDFGTTLIIGVIWLMITFLSKKYDKLLLLIFGGGVIAAPLVVFFGLKQYQLERLLSFIFPEKYSAASYNTVQAVRAIGSGGITGRGYLQGPMNLYNYVPADETDFIFSVAGEELGFIGAVLIIIFYCLLIWRLWKIAASQKHEYEKLVSAGIITLIAFHLVENIGMNLSLMPVTGIPLPFISYGGSSSLIFAAELGLIYKFSNLDSE